MDSAQGAKMEKIAGANIEIVRRGQGRPVLFLHPHIGLHGSEALIECLARRAQVMAPSHPGFGHSELPKGMSTVDDMSYFYLDMIEQLNLRELVIVGASFGGWIAAEIATKTCERLSRLVLIGAVGAKFGERDKSDLLDIFATPRSRWEERSFRNPAVWLRDYESLPEEELTAMARNREATALFAWNPYMYNPKLRARLHRIRIPTLFLWGAHDGFAPLAYGRNYCAALPGAKFEEIAEAGHFPHMEQPEAVARRVIEFGLERQAAPA
jgi:pimeloyl-ACP methyl ester carboxylesterase